MADVDTKKVDFDRAASLLSVVHQCAAVGPKLTHLGNAAMTELTELNDKIKVASQEAEKKLQAELAAAKARENAKLARDAQLEEGLSARTVPDTRRDALGNEDPNIRPSVYPGDSNTATIADRRL